MAAVPPSGTLSVSSLAMLGDGSPPPVSGDRADGAGDEQEAMTNAPWTMHDFSSVTPSGRPRRYLRDLYASGRD